MGDESADDALADHTGFYIDPLKFGIALFCLLVFFVLYLLLPRGIRKQYFGAYPKRHAWSARSRRRGYGQQGSSVAGGSYAGGSSAMGTDTTFTSNTIPTPQSQQQQVMGLTAVDPGNGDFLPQNDEIVISAAMQQLRNPGVLIVAHGSRGKPKTVRLQLTESAITWRTETRKLAKPKMGKLHSVALSHIMYVDVGKQTTALRRVENAAVSETLCFSLLTKEGSLDLEANSSRERDALVSCFSLVLDEVHAQQNWRDIYRGPSSDMPSSFDEVDKTNGANTGPRS